MFRCFLEHCFILRGPFHDIAFYFPIGIEKVRKIFLPSVRTEKGKNFVAYKGVKFWNDLDISIRETKPKYKFVKKLKKLMLSLMIMHE